MQDREETPEVSIEGVNMDDGDTAGVSTFSSILEWSMGLPDWQSDALRRILQQHELTDQDFKEILELFKFEHGLLKSTSVRAKRLDEKDIPTYSSTSSRVVLEGMRDLQNVNAIVPGQVLKFHSAGMTIVYGHNASGKSGYARVLKKACRARGEKESVLPNVFAPGAVSGPAQAIIDVNDSSNIVPLVWKEGQSSPDILAGVNVFDSRCARVYVDGANEVAYVPYGLDAFDKLAKLMEKIKNILQEENEAIHIDPNQLNDLRVDTVVGRMIQGLSHETLLSTIDACATLNETEKQRLSEAEKKLSELKVNDPKIKAESIRIKKRRIERLLKAVSTTFSTLSQANIADIRKSEQELIAAESASQLASQLSFKNEPLKGVTSDPWKLLFNAAKEFSEKYAYPGEEFPVTRQGVRCVLCFQELSAEAAARLQQFQSFVQNKTEQVLKSAQREHAIKIKSIDEVVVNPFSVDPELKNEVVEISNNLGRELQVFVSGAEHLHARIKESISTRKWDEEYAFPASPCEAIKATVTDLENQAREFDAIAAPEEKAKLENEFAELDSKRRFAAKREAVGDIVEKLKLSEKIRISLRATNTLAVSRKSAELMELLVTDQLKQNLKTEFQHLNVGYIKIDLSKSGRQGVISHKFKLQSSNHSNANLSDVLSEGEQRAIAIAAFLAELKTYQNNQGIVFDDPVSSLDHVRREQVACRLVAEAKSRQVIIFTHDLVFLTALQTACGEESVSYDIQTLWGNASGTGYCDPNAPWDGQKVSTRIGFLRGHALAKIKGVHSLAKDQEDYERRVDDFYKKLRQTWERTIEEIIFNDSIQRFRDSIETNRLKAVKFEDEDFKFVEENMAKCSKYLHDRAAGKGGIPAPEPKELEADLEKLDQFVARTRKRNDETKKQR